MSYTNKQIKKLSAVAIEYRMNDAGYTGNACMYKVIVFNRDGSHILTLTGRNGETVFHGQNDVIKNNIIENFTK
jgi:hypothetical protein